MKKARIARLPWECVVCSAAIFPGEVYLEETKRRHKWTDVFDTKRTCAACIKHAAEREAELEATNTSQGMSAANAKRCGSAFHHGEHWGKCDLCGGWSNAPKAVDR